MQAKQLLTRVNTCIIMCCNMIGMSNNNSVLHPSPTFLPFVCHQDLLTRIPASYMTCVEC